MAKSVLHELEALRALLRAPQGAPGDQSSPHAAFTALDVRRPDTTPLYRPGSAASQPRGKGSAERLGRAMEAAEAEVDAAVDRGHDVHRSLLRQKDLELAELQRLLAARDRAADALQEQLLAQRQSYDQRLAATEAAAAERETEAGSLRGELLALRAERDTAEQRLRDADAAAGAIEADAEAAQAAAEARLRSQGQELAAAVAECERQRRDRELLCIEVGELQREVESLQAAARSARAQAADATERCRAESEARRDAEAQLEAARAEVAFVKEAKDIEVSELRRRLRAERAVRKACERWLRAELRTREEMEALLLAVRDTALGRPAAAAADGGEDRGIEILLESLQQPRDRRGGCSWAAQHGGEAAAGGDARDAPGPSGRSGRGAAGPAAAVHQGPRRAGEADGRDGSSAARRRGAGDPDAQACRRDFSELKQQLRGDGARLREQVSAAKALLRERLARYGGGGGAGGNNAR